MHKILDELHALPGVFDSVVGNVTNVSHDIMEYVKCPTLQLDSYSRVSGLRESPRNLGPAISTTFRTASTRVVGGLYYYIKLDAFNS